MLESDVSAYDIVVIDGRSGSGKTSLAASISERMQLAACTPLASQVPLVPQVLHVEDLYPGWDGLAAGSSRVAVALREGGYRLFDWHLGEFTEWVPIQSTLPLIIEGCGALTAENLAAAKAWAELASNPADDAAGGSPPRVHAIWLDCPDEVRKARALARDGDLFRPYWEMWAEQEEAHYALHRPRDLADEVRG